VSKKWDTRFLGLAAHVSCWSKDPSSQVGAVITDGNRIVSLGYNGFAAGVVDSAERLADRNCKLNLTIHAEENAMIFAKRDLRGCTVYVTHPPCPRCASKLIQDEVKRIVFISPSEDFLSRWADDLDLFQIIHYVLNTSLCIHLIRELKIIRPTRQKILTG